MTSPHEYPHHGPILSQFADDPEMAELVDLFVEELPARIEALSQAWSSGARGDVKRIAHQLKGAAGGYGFEPLGDSAGRLEQSLIESEQASGDDAIQRIASCIDDLLGVCRRVRGYEG